MSMMVMNMMIINMMLVNMMIMGSMFRSDCEHDDAVWPDLGSRHLQHLFPGEKVSCQNPPTQPAAKPNQNKTNGKLTLYQTNIKSNPSQH